jgi:hypothetical protein
MSSRSLLGDKFTFFYPEDGGNIYLRNVGTVPIYKTTERPPKKEQ